MQLLQLLKSKLHHARITYANPDYVGSIEIGAELMDRVGIQDGEMVYIWSVDHSARISTYAFRGPHGTIGLNGGAARLFQIGDRVVIAAFTWTDEPIEPKMVVLDEQNKVIRNLVPFSIVG